MNATITVTNYCQHCEEDTSHLPVVGDIVECRTCGQLRFAEASETDDWLLDEPVRVSSLIASMNRRFRF